MWREIGKAFVVSFLIPVTVQVLQQLAIKMAEDRLRGEARIQDS